MAGKQANSKKNALNWLWPFLKPYYNWFAVSILTSVTIVVFNI